MTTELGIHFDPGQHKFAVVVSRYNREITEKLRRGAMQTLTDSGVLGDRVLIAPVPGAWELAVTTSLLIDRPDDPFSAIICLGAVIKGETTHDEHINRSICTELNRLACDYSIPVSLGLLTCNSYAQAEDRAGGAVGNKGIEAARAAIEMVAMIDSLSSQTSD